jgi:hypothetical protein
MKRGIFFLFLLSTILTMSRTGDQTDEALIKDAMRQAWIAYHLAAALAAQALQRGGARKYCISLLQRMSKDIHYFVLQSCKVCHMHHHEYCARVPIRKCGDFERWVFDLHNCVNRNLDKPIEKDFDAVRDYYRGQIESLGTDANVTSISKAMPAIFGRYCYDC